MASLFYTIATSDNNVNLPTSGQAFRGNARTFALQGTFSGCTVNIEASYDGGTNYIQLTDSDGSALNITSESIVNISVGVDVLIRFVVTNLSSGTTDIEVYAA